MNDNTIVALTEFCHFQCIDDFKVVYLEKTNNTVVLDSDLNFIVTRLMNGECSINEFKLLAKKEFFSETDDSINDFITLNMENLVAQEVVKVIN